MVQSHSRRQSVQHGAIGGSSSASHPHSTDYRSLDNDGLGKKGLLDPNDPFGDPFADDETPAQEKPRMECGFSGFLFNSITLLL